MPDACAAYRKNEIRPLYGAATAPTGSTLTIQASPAPSYTIYDTTGTAVSGHSAQAATGYDVSAAATVRAWKNLDTSVAALVKGRYEAVFQFDAAGPDSVTRRYRPSVGFYIFDPWDPNLAKTWYPGATDLLAFLDGHGFGELFTSELLLALLPGAAAGAVAELERRLGRRLLAGTEDSTRYFDPPVNREGHLFLYEDGGEGDLVELTSVTYQPTGGAAQVLTQGTDFVLEPRNGPLRAVPEPYTRLRFLRRWWGPLSLAQRGSLQIVGRWGYADVMPEDLFQALLKRAGLGLFAGLTQQATGGILSWTDGDRRVEYGVERWENYRKSWTEEVERVVPGYRGVRL